MLGESLGSLNFKDLKSLEIRLEKGISRIRSKKVSISYYGILLVSISWGLSNMFSLLFFSFLFSFPFLQSQTEWAVVCWDRVYAKEGNYMPSLIHIYIPPKHYFHYMSTLPHKLRCISNTKFQFSLYTNLARQPFINKFMYFPQ